MERTSNKDNRSFIVKIDKKDNIIFANQDWFSFAEENGAAELQPASVKGQSLWEFICDAETVYLYQTLFTKTREQGKCIKIPFRCDSPDCRRLMRMDIIPCDHGEIMLKSHVVRIDPREYVHLLDATADRSDDFVRMCSYCKKNFHPGQQLV